MRSTVNLVVILSFSLCLAMGCSGDDAPVSYSYLALGDSYTIGQDVAEEDRWPIQLAEKLRSEGTLVRRPQFVARTGWKTTDLMAALDESEELNTGFDLVSLLIGVNNQFQGRSVESFEPEFEEVLQRAISLARGNKDRVFVLSIPDYGVTAFGGRNGTGVSEELVLFNAVCKRVSEAYGVAYFNITPISQRVVNDETLLASDRLHPSGKMYGLWVDLIWEDVRRLLN